MVAPTCPAEEFIELFEQLGPRETARRLDLPVDNIYQRRRYLEREIGRQITAPKANGGSPTRRGICHPQRLTFDIHDGVVLVGSDAHYWPGIVSTAHKAFVRACGEMSPRAIVMNGDVLDGSSISRHPPIGWEDRPSVEAEAEACKERLAEIQNAAPNAERFWTLGNHDGRFETRLATVAPEYAKMHGFHLKDHFPQWAPCWAVWINDAVVVKHRWKGGLHATHNNTIWAGKTMVTGHLHSLKVTPLTDYNGTRWGVDCGTLADPYGPQFRDYTETNPLNWRSGFAVLTFRDGELLDPELVRVRAQGEVVFRGKVYEV